MPSSALRLLLFTVGKGNPTNTMGVVPGDTYWNTTDNNFWIFNNNIWNVLETGLNESIFFGKTGYFIPPLLSGLWDTTVNTIITLNIVTLSGLVEVEFFVTADINGNLTVSQPDVPGLYISVIDQGTPSVQLITEHKVGRATTLIRAGQDILCTAAIWRSTIGILLYVMPTASQEQVSPLVLTANVILVLTITLL